jgi:hypothetical protein
MAPARCHPPGKSLPGCALESSSPLWLLILAVIAAISGRRPTSTGAAAIAITGTSGQARAVRS